MGDMSKEKKPLNLCVLVKPQTGHGPRFVLFASISTSSVSLPGLQAGRCWVLSFPSTSWEPISRNWSNHPLPENLLHEAAESQMRRGCRAGIWKERIIIVEQGMIF